MKRRLGVAAAVAAFCLWGSAAFAQSGLAPQLASSEDLSATVIIGARPAAAR